MSQIQVALFDKSPIIKKMLSHCLHYFAADIHSFLTLEEFLIDLQKRSRNVEDFNAIFVDWEISQGNEPLIYHLQKQFHNTTLILLYRSDFDSAIPNSIPYRIKKPINPKEVRDLFIQVVPALKKSNIHSSLEFPKTKVEKQEEEKKALESQSSKSPEEATLIKSIVEKTSTGITNLIKKTTEKSKHGFETLTKQTFIPKSNKSADALTTNTETTIEEPKKEGQAQPLTTAPLEEPKKESQVKSLGTAPLEEPKKESQVKPLGTAPLKEPKKESQVKPLGTMPLEEPKKEVSSNQKSALEALLDTPKAETKTGATPLGGQKLDKNNLRLNEDTKNELAPMAIKSSFDTKSKKNLFESEEQIVDFFKKYKDSLNFQQVLEKVLKEEFQNVVENLLKGAEVNKLLKEPLQDFKESHQFKELVEKEISSYVKKELPFIIKSLLEEEIKKIIA